ncbi:SMC-Scp complex subunit ScpB [Granulicella cerasi]|uniref:SMC-Scp complex subunit ScpB n=1 Tax=Granulicella cerasi TaxID=741063 RepID=A0ABW1Z9H0_9BACT|nr:SMC-Scp complex subunit ScpB [Granulicella cerasi]
MSLKAKIEAVIYASEEPVTLVQLVGLLGEEAQLELDALEAQQPSLDLGGEDANEPNEIDPEAMNAETLSGTEETAETAAEEAPAADVTPVEATPENVAAAQAEDASTKAQNEKAVAAEAKVRERKLRVYFREVLDQLIAEYANNDRGFEVREVAGGFRFATKPEYHDAVRGFVKSLKPPLKLSLQALETLAVIAYKQPITAPEVSEIRGVDSGGVIGSLITRKLVQTAGRKQVIGRPMLYKTSKEFLVRFGLKDINELPSIEEFEKMAGELAEAVQEEMQMDAATESGNVNEETAATQPPAVDEINAAPAPAQHESVEDTLADKGKGDGADDETRAVAEEVEPNAEVHEAQADGEPENEE